MSTVKPDTNDSISSTVAQFYHASTTDDPDRILAWVNSLCLLVLAIGVGGASKGIPTPKPLPNIEQPIPALVEPVQPPPQKLREVLQPNDTQEDALKTPPIVVVTPDSPAIDFAVPTIGNVLVPNAMAAAPALKPLAAVAPLKQRRASLSSTGTGGSRPEPPYPKIALQQRQQGTVMLLMSVNDAGEVVSIEVKHSSGHRALDDSALEFVRKHWTVVPGNGTRQFEATINYRLR